MSRCDEGVVRTLFDEHGGDTLTAKDILDVMDSYTAKCGAPIVDGEVALQIATFARENSSLAIGVDEFLSMIRSLENETDSSTDDGSNASLFEGNRAVRRQIRHLTPWRQRALPSTVAPLRRVRLCRYQRRQVA